jgi:hypothetical protein
MPERGANRKQPFGPVCVREPAAAASRGSRWLFYLRLGAGFADASGDLGRLRTFLWPWTLHSPKFRFFSHALTADGAAGMLGP